MKDITLYEFNSLNEFEKGEVLWEHGVHVSERFKGECGMLYTNLAIFMLK